MWLITLNHKVPLNRAINDKGNSVTQSYLAQLLRATIDLYVRLNSGMYTTTASSIAVEFFVF